MGPGSDPFAADGEWLKTALHTHTSVTDGELEPRAGAEHYEWAGFDVLEDLPFVRVVATDVEGRSAWTNPF